MRPSIVIILLFFSVVFPIAAYAQNTGKLKLGLAYSNDRCYRTLENTSASKYEKEQFDARNDQEVAQYGFAAGLHVEYRLTGKFAINGGVNYAKRGFTRRDPHPSYYNGGFNYYTAVSEKMRRNYCDIDIPVSLVFNPGTHRLTFISSAGLALNIFRALNTCTVVNTVMVQLKKTQFL